MKTFTDLTLFSKDFKRERDCQICHENNYSYEDLYTWDEDPEIDGSRVDPESLKINSIRIWNKNNTKSKEIKFIELSKKLQNDIKEELSVELTG